MWMKQNAVLMLCAILKYSSLGAMGPLPLISMRELLAQRFNQNGQTPDIVLNLKTFSYLSFAPHLAIGGARGSGKTYATQLIAKALSFPTRYLDCQKIIRLAQLCGCNDQEQLLAYFMQLIHFKAKVFEQKKNTVIISHASALAAYLKRSAYTLLCAISQKLLERQMTSSAITICLSELADGDFVKVRTLLEENQSCFLIPKLTLMPVGSLSLPERFRLFNTFLTQHPWYKALPEFQSIEADQIINDVVPPYVNCLPTPALMKKFTHLMVDRMCQPDRTVLNNICKSILKQLNRQEFRSFKKNRMLYVKRVQV